MQKNTAAPLLAVFLLLSAMACVHDLDEPCVAAPGACVSGEDVGLPVSPQDGARPLVAGIAALPFVSISEGGAYPDGLALQVRAPAGTAYVVYSSGNDVIAIGEEATALFGARATFGSFGPKEITARAFDNSHVQRAEGRVSVTVGEATPEAQLQFLSPAAEGGSYQNGIWFKVAARGPVVRVRYSADGWLLGESTDPSQDYAVRYTFSLVGERRVVAESLSEDGNVLASAERRIIVVDPSAPAPTTRAGRAAALLAEHNANRVVFWDEQFGGRQDGADAYSNIDDTAHGGSALRSVHGNAPGGAVNLSVAMLDGLIGLEARGFSTFVTSIAGGSHSSGSLHYQGRAFDVDEINGIRIIGDTSLARTFMNACWQLGAIEVFGPSNDPVGHRDHIHCAW